MKRQAIFSSKDKSKNNKSVVCCNFAWRFKAENRKIACVFILVLVIFILQNLRMNFTNFFLNNIVIFQAQIPQKCKVRRYLSHFSGSNTTEVQS